MSLFKKKGQKPEKAAASDNPGTDPMDASPKPEHMSGPESLVEARESLDDPVFEEQPRNDDAAPVAKARFAGFLSRKILLIAIPALLLVVTASGLLLLKFGNRPGPKETQGLEPVTSITRPIPVPDYREMLDFLVLNEAEDQKTITSLRIEVCFSSPSRYQVFKDQNVVFRDTVYFFLQKQNASRNTTRNWQTLVEKELLEYLKVSLPQSWADAIKLTQVENL